MSTLEAILNAGEPAARRSKQVASRNIVEQSRKRQLQSVSAASSSSIFPKSVYGEPRDYGESPIPEIVRSRETISNALLNTVSDMYFGTNDPFAEILRCMDDRIDSQTRRYVSGLETLLKTEVLDPTSAKNKANREKIIITPLDMLSCAFRKQDAIDSWTPYDVILFELTICECREYDPEKLGRHFEGRKSLDDITNFFNEVYSKSDNWKRIQNYINKGDSQEMSDAESIKSNMKDP